MNALNEQGNVAFWFWLLNMIVYLCLYIGMHLHTLDRENAPSLAAVFLFKERRVLNAVTVF